MFQYQGNNFCNKLGITLCNLQILIWDVLCVWRGEKTQPNSDKTQQEKNPQNPQTRNHHNRKQKKAEGIKCFWCCHYRNSI